MSYIKYGTSSVLVDIGSMRDGLAFNTISNYFNQIKIKTPKENEIKEEYEIYLTNLIKQNDLYYKRFFIIISLVDENFQNYNEELNHRCNLLCSMIKKCNNSKIIENKKDVLEILNFLYRL